MKEEGIGGPPIRFQPEKENNDFFSFDINTTDSEDELGGQGVGAQEKVDKKILNLRMRTRIDLFGEAGSATS